MSGRWYLFVLVSIACGAPGPSRNPAAVAPWLRADPRRCLLARDLREGMEIMARRCAEEFVRQNGYTDAPATSDFSRWAREWGENGPWQRVLRMRAATLARSASGFQCSRRQCLVLFRLRRPGLSCAYRTVSMTQVFTRIQLDHGAVRDRRCGVRRV